MIDTHCRLARRLAEGLRAAGLQVLNEVVLNQVLVRADTDEQTTAWREAALADGRLWFGTTRWQGRVAVRLSLSSWRTTPADIEEAIEQLGIAAARLRSAHSGRPDTAPGPPAVRTHKPLSVS